MLVFRSAVRRTVLLSTVASALVIAGPNSAVADEPVKVVVDQATLIKLPGKASTIVVGNPLIADVSLQSGGTVVVTGKGYGVTNVMALDQRGAVILEKLIRVEGASDKLVTIYRGIERESYSCTPTCQRRITLGDAPNYFTSTLTQSGALNAQAMGVSGERRE